MALPIGETPRLYPSESVRFLKKMMAAKKGTAEYIATPKLADAEKLIRETGKPWKEEAL